jgi:hypothetical protein
MGKSQPGLSRSAARADAKFTRIASPTTSARRHRLNISAILDNLELRASSSQRPCGSAIRLKPGESHTDTRSKIDYNRRAGVSLGDVAYDKLATQRKVYLDMGIRRIAPLNVLFIGNSFTARNDLPSLIAQLAASRGKNMQHYLISAGGASLRAHWNAGLARKAIETRHYDRVVLQEQSTLPIKNAKRMHENVRLFDEAIKAAGAKTSLYMTWARQSAPDSQQAITDAYTSIGEELRATVVPVGVAWQSFLRKHDQPVLHDKDQSHPTLAGSYLAACVFLAVFFEENPVGIADEVAGLTPNDRRVLQQTAWRACK